MRDITVSRNGLRALKAFFGLLVVFLYAPIVILVIFSFNKGTLPTFPLEGFTLRWYREFFSNREMLGALRTSAVVAALSSTVAVSLGVLCAILLVRRRFWGKSTVSGLLLSPLVIPYVVFGISLLMLFQTLGVPLSILTVVVGHTVLSLPYTVLVLIPRLERISVALEEAARDLGASGPRTFRSITLPLIVPAILSAFLIAFTLSFDEYAVASFVIGSEATFPIYLFSQLRFPSRLPQAIAVAVVVMMASIVVVLAAEVGRRIADRRLEAQLGVAEEEAAEAPPGVAEEEAAA